MRNNNNDDDDDDDDTSLDASVVFFPSNDNVSLHTLRQTSDDVWFARHIFSFVGADDGGNGRSRAGNNIICRPGIAMLCGRLDGEPSTSVSFLCFRGCVETGGVGR